MQVLFFSLIIATAIWVVSAGDRLERIQRNSFSYYAADLKNSKQLSALRQRTSELGSVYFGYEEQLERLTKNAYEYINQERL